MSIENVRDTQSMVSRTVVTRQADPVAQARAELKAALFAIEDKTNVPHRLAQATDAKVRRARRFTRDNPGAAAAITIGVAAAIGAVVWAAVRAYVR